LRNSRKEVSLRTITAAAIMALLFLLSGSLCFGAAQENHNAAALESQGRVTYQQSCTPCHDTLGFPTPAAKSIGAPDLGSPAVRKLTDAQIRKQISDGGKYMPPFKSTLSTDQINALVVYVRTFAKEREQNQKTAK